MELTCTLSKMQLAQTLLGSANSYCLNGAWSPDLSSVVSHLSNTFVVVVVKEKDNLLKISTSKLK